MIFWLGCACTSSPPVSPMAPPTPKALPEVNEPRGRPEPSPAVFEFVATPLDEGTRAAMRGVTWRAGCPVSLDDLVRMDIRHWNFAGEVVTGRLIGAAVHTDVYRDVFARAFAAHYPIERMEPMIAYGGSDARSMAANNTSAFNCRAVTGGGRFSEHSHGHAIDINPLRNPYIARSGKVLPPEGMAYADRTRSFPGKLEADGAVVRAFRDHGWGWGGAWKSIKDYQHFSVNGR